MICGRDYFVTDLSEDTSALLITGNHRLFLVARGLGDRLRAGIDRLEQAERAEWEQLVRQGLVSEENRTVLANSRVADGADLAINVNLTNICNLACTYCFADGGDYGRIKEAMRPESIEWIFRFIEERLVPGQRVRFEFFGGEPLANFPLIDQICERSVHFAQDHGVAFVYRISTNLTLLPTGAADLFALHRFIVSVSLDGGRTSQDANRPSKNGRGSFDRILRNVRAVRAASDDITLVARMTVASRRPTVLENVRELHALNLFDYFQIYPAVYPEERPATVVGLPLLSAGREVVPAGRPAIVNFFLQEGMTEQFLEFVDAYPSLFSDDNRFRGVLEYERIGQMMLDGLTALSFCSGGRSYFTHSPDGSFTSCHRLVGDSSFDVGAGAGGVEQEPRSWQQNVDAHPVCSGCWARYACGGGCKQENFAATGDIHGLNEDSCRYQLLLTEQVMRTVASRGREYRERDRDQLADLFVSCGRPVLPNGRAELPPDARPRHFVPVEVTA